MQARRSADVSHRILLLFLRSAKVAVTVIRRDGNVVEGNVELLGDVLSWLEDILEFFGFGKRYKRTPTI